MAQEKTVDINDKATITSIVMLGTIGVLSFIVQPGLVQGFVTELGLSEAAANDLAFAEMAGIALATIVMIALSRLPEWRRIMACSLALAIAGNIASMLAGGGTGLSAARFLAGLGEGGVISLSFTMIGLTRNIERNLAWYLVMLLTYGALGLWAMPSAFELIGLSGIFLLWAVATLLSLATLPYLPSSVDSRPEARPGAVQMAAPWLAVALCGVLIYNLAIGTAWANLFLIGMTIRPDAQAVAFALLLSQFVAIAGALAAVFLDARLGRLAPITFGVLAGAGAIGLLLGEPSFAIYAFAICAFNFLWNLVIPYILGAVADMDSQDRMMAPAIAMQMIGLGAGPFLAARILDSGGGFLAVEIAVIMLLVVSVALLVATVLVQREAGTPGSSTRS